MNRAAQLRLQPQQKLQTHPQFHRYLAGEPVYPIGMEISPSGVCNATCDFCFYAGTAEDQPGYHRKRFLKLTRTLEILDEAAYLGMKSITWTGGGDPSLSPYIHKFVDHVKDLRMEQGMFTNALAYPKYDPAKLSWIRITMTDKPAKPEYIKMLRPTKALGFAFNYSGPQDIPYLWETLHLAEDVMADYVQVRPALAFSGKTVNIEPPNIEHPLLHVTGYKFEEARKPHGYKRCEAYHFVPFLWENGDVDVCAYMQKWEGYNLGNIYRDRLREILSHAPDSVPVAPMCQVCCKLHEMNQAIHSARALEDVNFP